MGEPVKLSDGELEALIAHKIIQEMEDWAFPGYETLDPNLLEEWLSRQLHRRNAEGLYNVAAAFTRAAQLVEEHFGTMYPGPLGVDVAAEGDKS